MPKNRRRKSTRRGRRGFRGSPAGFPVDEVFSGNYAAPYTTIIDGTAQLVLALAPVNFGTRAAAVADLYRLFRFTSLRAHFLHASTVTEYGIVAFSPGILVASQPTTFAEVSQMEKLAIVMPGQTTVSTLALGRKELSGIVPWYETVGAATEPLLDTQGQIVIASHFNGVCTADTLTVRWEFTIEFAGRLPAAASLQRLRESLEREALPKRVRELGLDDDPEDADSESTQSMALVKVPRLTKAGNARK